MIGALDFVTDEFGRLHIGIGNFMGLSLCGEFGDWSYARMPQYDLASESLCRYCAMLKASMN